MPKLQETVELKLSPEKVFAYLDDVRNTGWHMMQHSPMMFGSKLDLETISDVGVREDTEAGGITFAANPADPLFLAANGYPPNH